MKSHFMPLFLKALKTLRLGDGLLIFFSLGIAFGSAIYVYGNSKGEPRLVIESPKGKWIYELQKDLRIPIQGTEGNTIVQIEGNRAFVVDSPCANKVCISAHPIERNSQWIACMPNQVFLRIEGFSEEDTETDIISF